MSTRTIAILAGLLGLCVALALTNLTTQDYGVFLEKQLGLAMDRMDRTLSGQERELYTANGKKLVDLVVQKYSRRRNFGLFSLFEARVLEQRVVVIGIASTFLPVQGVEEVVVKIEQLILTLKR